MNFHTAFFDEIDMTRHDTLVNSLVKLARDVQNPYRGQGKIPDEDKDYKYSGTMETDPKTLAYFMKGPDKGGKRGEYGFASKKKTYWQNVHPVEYQRALARHKEGKGKRMTLLERHPKTMRKIKNALQRSAMGATKEEWDAAPGPEASEKYYQAYRKARG